MRLHWKMPEVVRVKIPALDTDIRALFPQKFAELIHVRLPTPGPNEITPAGTAPAGVKSL